MHPLSAAFPAEMQHSPAATNNASNLRQVAIAVLTDSGSSKRGMGKQEFLNRMAESLTASEQVWRAVLGGVWLGGHRG